MMMTKKTIKRDLEREILAYAVASQTLDRYHLEPEEQEAARAWIEQERKEMIASKTSM